MNKDQFIQELKQSLANLPYGEVEDIIRDQEEYIREAVAAGRTEEDVITSLGSAKNFAANLTAENKIQRAQDSQTLKKQMRNTFDAVFAILALAPLNLIFVLGPFLAASGIIVGGWATSLGIFVSAIAMLAVFFFKLIFVSAGFWNHFSTFFFSLGFVGLGCLSFILMFAITRYFLSLTARYLSWNLNFIRAHSIERTAV